MVEKILVPTDGSESSLRAAQFTAELVKIKPEITTIIFTVDRVPLQFLERDLYWIASDMSEKSRHIKEVFEELRQTNLNKASSYFKRNGLKVWYDYSYGNPAEEIAAYARKNNVDMIIMGTRGLSAIKEVFLGSVSHKVLQLASCPVVLVK